MVGFVSYSFPNSDIYLFILEKTLIIGLVWFGLVLLGLVHGQSGQLCTSFAKTIMDCLQSKR